MKILYVGGNGQISFDCVHESVRAGHETWVFNRGNANAGLPPEVSYLRGDFDDDAQYTPIADEHFDVVCQFRVFTPQQLKRDLDLLTGKVGRYVFISSASAYRKPVEVQFITEDVPLDNPHWAYSRDKAACEALLRTHGDGRPGSPLPWTVVRPSHTSRDMLITALGEHDLLASRLLRGKPVVVPGDGTSLWTVTDSQQFAPPFVRLLTADAALGEAFHLTSDRAYAWRTLYHATARALGVEAELVGVPTDTLVAAHPAWAGPLWGDKAWSAQFDHTKIRAVVGDLGAPPSLEAFVGGRVAAARERMAREDPLATDRAAALDRLFDRLTGG
ncbi:MAG: NAD-dependent epimerase/dehydratase family protein [Planctomycetota bacterium]